MTGNTKGNHGNVNKGFSKGENNRNIQKNPLRLKPPIESRISEQSRKTDNEGTARPPIQCWGCGGPHYIKNFPNRKGTEQVSQIHEASTVGDMGRSLPRINAALEDRQAEYEPTMVEFEGKIFDYTIAVLIDPRATLSYVSPKVVEKCKLQTVKFKEPWLIQLATGAKRRVLAKVNNCPSKIAGQSVMADLNVLPLGSYDVLINRHGLVGKTMVHYKLKGCQIYAIQVGYANSKDKTVALESILVIQDFVDVFPEEIPGLPPKRDINFTIKLVSRAASISQAPYRMSTPELTELKMQLQEPLDKNDICPSVSP
eukprot:PITA_19619